jgi:hypothetical protein
VTSQFAHKFAFVHINCVRVVTGTSSRRYLAAADDEDDAGAIGFFLSTNLLITLLTGLIPNELEDF